VISLVEGGALTPPLFGLHIGDRVHIGEPRGLFRLDDADERDHLLIGTGSGIAPLLSMVAALGSRSEPPRTILLHGARVREELAGQELTALRNGTWLSYRPTLSRAPATDAAAGLRGRVGEHLDALISEGELAAERTVAYLCGNGGMIDGARARLAAFGVSIDAIRREPFGDGAR
jgi:ferredoxin-NADP reductase